MAAARTLAAAQAAAQQQAVADAQQQQQQIADGFLAHLSNESLEVLSHFGPEAPNKLNAYACQVEDALLQAVEHQRQQATALQEQYAYIEQAQEVFAAAQAKLQAMEQILTDPDALADYVKGFYAPDGPYPVQTSGEEAQSRLEQGMVDPTTGRLVQGMGHPNMDLIGQQAAAEEQQQQQQRFERPSMPPIIAPQGGSRMAGTGLWGDFSQLMDTRPQDAWKLLDQASPEELRRKILVMEG